MSTKQLLSPKARGLIEAYRVDVQDVTMTGERGGAADYREAEQDEAKSKEALETYVLHLERKARRLKSELNRTMVAYKLLLDKVE